MEVHDVHEAAKKQAASLQPWCAVSGSELRLAAGGSHGVLSNAYT